MRRRKIYLGFVSIFILLIVWQINVPSSSAQTRKVLRRSMFQPGDAVRIEIIEVEVQSSVGAPNFDLDGDYPIAKDGTIFMPLVGNIKVTGHNQESLTKLIADKYSPYFNEPFITVTPLIRLVLMGAFHRPGSFRINPQSSLWELIDLANGPADDCDLHSLRVERGGKVIIGKLLGSFEQGHSLKDIGIRSGDQIVAEYKKHFGLREVMDYTRFGISLIVLYLQFQRYND